MLQSSDSNLFHKHKHWSVLLLLPPIERKKDGGISHIKASHQEELKKNVR